MLHLYMCCYTSMFITCTHIKYERTEISPYWDKTCNHVKYQVIKFKKINIVMIDSLTIGNCHSYYIYIHIYIHINIYIYIYIYTHTHTHTHIYIYIYITYREKARWKLHKNGTSHFEQILVAASPKKQPLDGDLRSISKTIQVKRTIHVEHITK